MNVALVFTVVTLFSGMLAEDYNVCLLTESQLSEMVACGYRDPAFEKVRVIFDEQLTRFPGISPGRAIQMVCKSSGDDGNTILEEFKDGLAEEDQYLIYKVIEKCTSLAR